jgi:AcrR family transcriptional regulator
MPTLPATRKTRATHAALIAATREVVRRYGSAAPEMVAETAGVSPATVYSYFGSKDGLLAVAFDAALEDINHSISTVLDIERLLENGWESTARALVRSVVRRFSHDARLVRLAIARLPESDEVRQVYRRRQEEALNLVRRFIHLGKAAGQLRPAEDEVLARAAVVILQGLQNPLVLQSGAGPIVDEISGAMYRLLAPQVGEGRGPDGR